MELEVKIRITNIKEHQEHIEKALKLVEDLKYEIAAISSFKINTEREKMDAQR